MANLGVLLFDQISEYEIIEISENVCNLKKQEADWILKIDIVEQGDRLEVRMVYLAFKCRASRKDIIICECLL